jgi:amino acid transporter
VLGVAMAQVYGELVSAFPETGAEYTVLGRTLGPTAGFMTLGLVLTGFTVAQALTALGVASYLDVIWPGLNPVAVAIILIVAVNALAILNIRLNAVVTGAFLATEVISLTAVSVLGFSHIRRSPWEVLVHPVVAHGAALGAVPAPVLGVAAAGAIYAFNGFGGVVSIGEEMHDAPRHVARVIFWALGLAAVLELAPMVAVTVGARDLHSLLTAPAPIPAFIAEAGGRTLGVITSVLVGLAIVNTMIAVALMAGRQLFSTGRDGVWPGPVNRALASLHPRFNSPWIATLVMGGISVLWSFAPLKLLVTIVASGTVVIYSGLCLAVIQGRRNSSTAHGRYRMPLFPLAPLLALAALVGVLWTGLTDAEVGRPSLMACAVVMATWAMFYRLWLRRRGGWAHRGPSNIEAAAE